MIKRLVQQTFIKERPLNSVAAAALVISLAGFASRILGVVRDHILAGTFGAGDTLDAYYAAFRVPDLIYNLMIVGALSAAFIPIFTELISEDKEEDAWLFSSGVLILQITATVIVSVILVIFAPQLMRVVTPGFAGEKMDLTVLLSRIMFISTFFLGISGIMGGVLVSFKKFLVYSLAPIFYNFGIIIGAVFFVKHWGPIGLAWGVVIGAFMHMAIQYPTLRHSGFKFKLSFFDALRNKSVRKFLRLMVPRTMTVAVAQINFTVITIFASTLTTGSLAVFNFANNIQSAPLGLFGISFSIAVFPTLSALASKKNDERFLHVYSKTFRQIIFFIIPISVMLFVLRAQSVRLLLGSGNFNWDDTRMTFQTLGIFAISLFAQSLVPLLTRAFYAIQNTMTPFYITIGSVLVSIATAFMLIQKYQIFGLAIAFSFSSAVEMILLMYFLRKSIGSLDGKNILKSAIKIILASLAAGASAQVAKIIVGSQGELDTVVAVLNQFIIAGITGLGAFTLASYYLHIEEFFQFKDAVTKKLFRVKKVIEEGTEEVTGI